LRTLGRHLLLELYDCDRDVLDDLEQLQAALLEAARRAGATIIDVVFHRFSPAGVSGVVVIAESHLSIHTWPESGYAAVDVFSCGETMNTDAAATLLIDRLASRRSAIIDIPRGRLVSGALAIRHSLAP
jgi:S-adenosylmethionine decarboxylase